MADSQLAHGERKEKEMREISSQEKLLRLMREWRRSVRSVGDAQAAVKIAKVELRNATTTLKMATRYEAYINDLLIENPAMVQRLRESPDT